MNVPHHSLFLGCILSIALLCGCDRKSPEAIPKPVRSVIVAKAEAKDIPVYYDEIGNCTAYETVMVQPLVSGAIFKIHFKDGTELKEGDPLFTIDPRPFQAALDKARATLAQDRAKAKYDQLQVNRSEELSKGKIIAPKEFDSLVATAEGSQAAAAADEALVVAAELNLENCAIRSPINGRASKRMVDKGNVVTANTSQLLLIQRQDPIYVDFAIPEASLPEVRKYHEKGTLKVEASFADNPSLKREGSFDFLDAGVQQITGTVWVRAMMENKDHLFWPGQFVNVKLLLDTIKDAVMVPAAAVQVGQTGPFVFVVKEDSTVELRKVIPGQRQANNIRVIEGLKPGETVVVTGQIAIAPGAKVKITEDK